MKKHIITLWLSSLLWGLGLPLWAQIYSDSTWERFYSVQDAWEGQYSVAEESYDLGYVFSKHVGSGAEEGKNSIIKTDINGYQLWEKVLLSNEEGVTIDELVQDSVGNIYIAMGKYLGNNDWVMRIAKFNVCMELEWCRQLGEHHTGAITALNLDKQGNIIALLHIDASDPICLVKLSPDGDLLWEGHYLSKSEYPVWSPNLHALYISEQNDYYISGYMYWKENPEDTGYLVRPGILKVKPSGEQDWVLPYGVGQEFMGFMSDDTFTQINDTLFTAIVGDYNSTQIRMLHITKQGEVKREIPAYLLSDIFYHAGNYGQPVDTEDGRFVYAMGGVLDSLGYNSRRGFVTIDTAFNILDYQVFDMSRPAHLNLIKTYHNSILCKAHHNEPTNPDNLQVCDIYLRKMHYDYSFDSVYTHWNRPYDSLCSRPIESGDIEITDKDCEIIYLGVDDYPANKAKPQQLDTKVVPNPVREQAQLSFENLWYPQLRLTIYNAQGQQVWQATQDNYPQGFSIRTQGWAKGVYIAKLQAGAHSVGEEKFVIMR